MRNSTLCRIMLVCCFSIMMITARAQYVAIPDTFFGKWLNTHGYTACMTGNGTTGWQLDTTCSAVANATSMLISYINIKDLTGVTYFRQLKRLTIGGYSSGITIIIGDLQYIPPLPASLRFLDCSANKLHSLPVLPALDTLICTYNKLAALPALPASLRYLNCSSDSLWSLPTLPAGLLHLDCQGDYISTLPTLPASLDYLDCSSNSNLTALPSLPSSMTFLDCSSNNFTALPLLPGSLKTLYCISDHLTSLPALPSTLTVLNCSNNTLTTLPALPSSLTSLTCNSDALTSLPSLPASLITLNCNQNLLSNLPVLPGSLNSLQCSYNPLFNLPILPARLRTLICLADSLSSLPTLPDTLGNLSCAYNNISSLPTLPRKLRSLDCRYNALLSCLPYLYQSLNLSSLFILHTNIQCLPNAIDPQLSPISTDVPSSFPVCSPSSGCPFYYNIQGMVHLDTSATCVQDSLTPGRGINRAKVLLKKNGVVTQQAYTSQSGEYTFKIDTFGNYIVEIDTTGTPWQLLCPVSGSRSIVLTASDSVETAHGFGIVCRGIDTFDIDYAVLPVSTIFGSFRPATQTHVNVRVADVGGQGLSSYCRYGTPTTDTSVQSPLPSPGRCTT